MEMKTEHETQSKMTWERYIEYEIHYVYMYIIIFYFQRKYLFSFRL